MQSVEEWIHSTIGSDSYRQVSELSSVPPATLNRQLNNNSVTVETVVKLARAYQVSVIPALLALDIVTESDLQKYASDAAVESASDEKLAEVVLKRMKAGSKLMAMPISEAEKTIEKHKNELAARRAVRVEPVAENAELAQLSEDEIVARINSGEFKVAAQKHTDPIDESFS